MTPLRANAMWAWVTCRFLSVMTKIARVLGTFVASLQTRAPGGEALRHGTVRSPVEPKRTQQGNGANREVSQAFQEVAPWHIADEQNGKDGHDEHEGRREVLCGDDAERQEGGRQYQKGDFSRGAVGLLRVGREGRGVNDETEFV